MPLDLSVLFNTTSFPSYSYSQLECDEEMGGGSDDGHRPPFACRKAASFPVFNRQLIKPSSLKRRCSSETTLKPHDKTLNGLTLQDLKRELSAVIIERMTADFAATSISLTVPSSTNDSDGSATCHDSSKSRKKVCFADDLGQTLFVVRVMAEPSDVPPVLTNRLALALIAAEEGEPFSPDQCGLDGGDPGKSGTCGGRGQSSTWTLDFPQPASDYLKFRKTLESKNVALENVLLKNDCHRLTGTVKVKNLSFEKNVFIRYTSNAWASFNDSPCEFYATLGAKKHPHHPDAYDTFQFDIEIPRDDDRLHCVEFCFCYRLVNQDGSKGQEFWDSNDNGQNFRLVSEAYRLKRVRSEPVLGTPIVQNSDCGRSRSQSAAARRRHFGNRSQLERRSSTDAFELEFDNWSEFSTWKHLDQEGPYW